jgi:hypothetical protein
VGGAWVPQALLSHFLYIIIVYIHIISTNFRIIYNILFQRLGAAGKVDDLFDKVEGLGFGV